MDFTDLKGLCVSEMGSRSGRKNRRDRHTKELPSVPPHGSAAVQYTGRLPEGGGRCFLRVRYLLRYPVSGLKEGWELGFDEAESCRGCVRKQRSAGKKIPETGRAALILDQTERRITVTGKDFTYVYDTFLGVFSEIKREKRIPTIPWSTISGESADNDRRIRLEWESRL